MLVTLKEVLKTAEEKGGAIPGFNIDNMETSEAVMEACEEEDWPVILTVGQLAVKEGKMEALSELVKRIGRESRIPVVLHLDHAISYEQIIQALRLGFTSVMYDGSGLPLEENIKESLEVIRSARAVGVSVEGELGAIGGVEDGIVQGTSRLVDIEQVKTFISSVSCDALAIGIGNAHGLYKGTPNLDFGRITACRRLNAPPLVLHGGSGIPDEMLRTAIKLGIRKINVATELRCAFMEGMKEATVKGGGFYEAFAAGKKGTKELARRKIRIFKES